MRPHQTRLELLQLMQVVFLEYFVVLDGVLRVEAEPESI